MMKNSLFYLGLVFCLLMFSACTEAEDSCNPFSGTYSGSLEGDLEGEINFVVVAESTSSGTRFSLDGTWKATYKPTGEELTGRIREIGSNFSCFTGRVSGISLAVTGPSTFLCRARPTSCDVVGLGSETEGTFGTGGFASGTWEINSSIATSIDMKGSGTWNVSRR
ncbi:MAG: hypothetical protein MRZ79_03315 [Bacteroidia bacterium]|nr:hypothetical protein [Bacteroidia bacterium]